MDATDYYDGTENLPSDYSDMPYDAPEQPQ